MEKTNLEHDKYKMFRNFMCNELGISKDDIKRWTMDSVAETVRGLIGQINIDSIVENEARKAIKVQYGGGSPELIKAVADILSKKIALNFKN